MGRRIELHDVQQLLRAVSENSVVIGKVKHIFDVRPCACCDRRAVVRVGKRDLCGTHAFGTPAKDRARLLVDRIGERR